MAEISILNPDLSQGPAGLTFNSSHGIKVQRFDPGFPEVRTVEDLRPHQHGCANYTKFFGAREVSIDFTLAPGPLNAPFQMREVEDIIRGLCNPVLRPYIVEQLDPTLPARRINIVAGDLTMPYEAYNRKQCHVSFRAPDGYWESEQLHTTIINPSEAVVGVSGRSYNLTFNRQYPLGQAPTGGTTLINSGSLDSYPNIRLYGPFTEATIRNATTDKLVKIQGVAVADGNYVELDFRNRTVLLNGDINLSYYNYVDWLSSEWWSLEMDENLISFMPLDYTAGSTKAIVTYRDNWL